MFVVFGASLKLGKLDPATDNKEAIDITGQFGINPGNPGENWIYGSVSTLTVDQVCKAFVLQCGNIPPAVLESGFPTGIVASFSSKG